MCDKVKLVSRLLAAKDTPFVKEDEARLNEMTEAQLTALAVGVDPDHKEKPMDQPPPDEKPVQLSEAEWLKAAPAGVRSLVERSQREEVTRRGGLVKALATAQKRKDEKALAAMSTEDLQDLYAILGLGEPEHDYSGVGLPTEPTAVSLVVQVPMTGAPAADAVSATDAGWPWTTIFGPPAAVIVPPAADVPPSQLAEVPPSSKNELPPSAPAPASSLESAKNGPLFAAPHAAHTTANASVRLTHRMTVPSR